MSAEIGATGGGYIAADELLFNPCSPCLRADLPKPLVNRSPKTYDMEAHYRFGGTIPTLQSQAWPPLYKEVLSFIGKEGTPGVMPSAPKLQAAGRGDLVKAIGRAGGWHKVATELGLQMAHSLREVYFTCPSALRSGQEIEFKLPGMPQRFAATIPDGVTPGDEFIVRVPPVLPSAAHGFVRGLDEDSARQRLLILAQEMEQMKLMQHEINVIKVALRTQDTQLAALKDRNHRLSMSRDAETTRCGQLARLMVAATQEFPLIRP